MRGISPYLGLLAALCLLCTVSFCHADDHQRVEVVGIGECADCKENSIKTSLAFSGLSVTIDCKVKNGHFQRRGSAELDAQGKFKVSLPKEILKDGNLKEECYAQLHSATATPCPAHNGLQASKLVAKSEADGKLTFGPAETVKFSSALCTSAFFWPYFKHPPLPKIKHPWGNWKKPFPKFWGHPPYSFPLPHHKPFPPIPIFKKPLPPPVPIFKIPHPPLVPIYKKPLPPPVPIFKIPHPPLVPIYKKPLPPPVPIYKQKPFPPPVPVYKPKPLPPPVPVYKKPLPPPVPIYKPKPKPPVYKPKPPVYKPKPLPPPVPIYKPKPKPPVYKPKPLPPPVPIYKPKPLPPPVPIYKPKPLPPPVPIYKPPVFQKPLPPPFPSYKPPSLKKPCPPIPHIPLPKLPPIPKIPPKYYFHHPIPGIFPPVPPASTTTALP